MCSQIYLTIWLPTWCENTPTLTSTAFPLAPYLLRELMNFSLARLLTSFKVPSSGLLHLLTPVAGVCFPRKETDGRFLCLCGRIRISTTLSGPTDWGKGTIYSISENGVGCVKLYRAHRLNTEIVFQLFTGRAVIFPGKVQFHHSLHLIKRQAESEIYTFWKVFSIENTISGQKYS